MNIKISPFIKEIEKSISENTFGRLTISNPINKKDEIKKVIIRQVKIKKKVQLSFVYRYKTKDITKNYDISKGIDLIIELFKKLNNAILFKAEENIELKIDKERVKIIHSKTTNKLPINFSHNKDKKRMVEIADNIYLKELDVLNSDYEIRSDMYNKFRQIDKYIEICNKLFQNTNLTKEISIMDMGAGKGYLTFALYDYLIKNNFTPKITGIEFRKNLVEKCNSIASKCGFSNLTFKEGAIGNTKIIKNDVLIALHACDTATDEAIYKGILSGSKLIICAPCCHKQIRKQFNVQNDFSSFLKHGILEERQAELITDAIRSLILEMYGYKTKVFEFISSEHTAKNIMIVGQKTKSVVNKDVILKKIQKIKDFYGIKEHFLEKLLQENDEIKVERKDEIYNNLTLKSYYIPILKNASKNKKQEIGQWNENWQISKTRNFNPHNYKKYDDYSKCIYTPCYINLDNNLEKDFVEHLEKNADKVVWWWQNGNEHMALNFGIKYGDFSTFQPDFIVMFEDGSVGIFDTKAYGDREEQNKIKAEALQNYIKEENQKGKNLFGGIIVKSGEYFLLNSDEEYEPFGENMISEKGVAYNGKIKGWNYFLEG